MYKKYCLIASILLIIPLFTTAMEVEEEEEEQQRIHILEIITGRSFFNIHIQPSHNRSFLFHSDHPLFSQSTFFRPMIEGGFQEKGTKSNPIILRSINGNQLELIVKFIEIKTKPTKPLKQYLQDFDINKLIELTNINKLSQLLEATNFLDIKVIFEFIVPQLVKQLQDPKVLDTWLQAGGNELLGENKELSDLIGQNLTNKIKPTPQYLQQKKSIPSDVLKIQGYITSLVFSSDLTMFAYVLIDSSNIIMWDVKKNTKLHTLTGHNGNVLAIAFNPNSTILA